MKFSAKSLLLGAVVSTASMAAMAADPIVGVWQMYEDGQPKAQVQISQSGSTFNGRVVSGQTAKAKEFVGKTVLMGIKANGGGKYTGKAKDPRWGIIPAVTANITVSGSKMSLSTIKGSQTWSKVR